MGNMIDCIYWGLFFDQKLGYSLECPVEDPHVTFGFKTPMPAELLGKKATVTVIGHGCDGRNQAVMVDLDCECWDVYQGAQVPHITLSTSKDGKPVDSADLDFEQWDPYEWYDLIGRFGYFDGTMVRFNPMPAQIVQDLPVENSVAYLCNGQKPECKGHADCFSNPASADDPMGQCRRTTDIRYARNFVPVDGDRTKYAEKEGETGKDIIQYEYHLETDAAELAGKIANELDKKRSRSEIAESLGISEATVRALSRTENDESDTIPFTKKMESFYMVEAVVKYEDVEDVFEAFRVDPLAQDPIAETHGSEDGYYSIVCGFNNRSERDEFTGKIDEMFPGKVSWR